jgi:hypothetical protein
MAVKSPLLFHIGQGVKNSIFIPLGNPVPKGLSSLSSATAAENLFCARHCALDHGTERGRRNCPCLRSFCPDTYGSRYPGRTCLYTVMQEAWTSTGMLRVEVKTLRCREQVC